MEINKTNLKTIKTRYDGQFKYLTADCPDCKWKRELKNSEDIEYICGWSPSYKFLLLREKPRHCEYVNKNPNNPSAARIDWMKNLKLEFGKPINYFYKI